MKKQLICLIAIVLVAAVLFIPMPGGTYEDGGSREYTALTYKIVDWNRLAVDGTYEATKIYWLPDNFKSIDELWMAEEQNVIHMFTATVLEISGNYVLVQPIEGDDALRSSDKISFSCAGLEDIGAEAGSTVDVYYRGGIMESYPAQVHATKWQLSGNLRHLVFADTWLDKGSLAMSEAEKSADFVIIKIYENCFIANSIKDQGYQYKFNGQLGAWWHVGDYVTCDFTNIYYDHANHRVEADILDCYRELPDFLDIS